MAANLKKDLQTVVKQLNGISKKVEKLSKAVAKLESGSSVKPKTVKKPPVKKKVSKTKKTVKKAASKKAQKMTAADTVLGLIQKYKRATSTGALMTKTGFDGKKIANIIYKLRKQGKIKSPKKGVYVKA